VPQSYDFIWRWCEMRTGSRPLLSLLLLVDITFIAVHLWLWSRGQLSTQLNIEADGSIPEMFNYLKWAASAVACAYAFSRRREPLYLAWAMLFFYFLLDDANQIHEQLGSRLVTAFDLGPALALRGQDFGELAVSLVAAMVLLGVMAVVYWKADNSDGSRRFTQRQLPWLAVLIFCGVIVDMLHVQISIFGSPILALIFGVIEDGGEMIAASFLTAASVRQAVGCSASCVGRTRSALGH
jgi:hypothetical protein